MTASPRLFLAALSMLVTTLVTSNVIIATSAIHAYQLLD